MRFRPVFASFAASMALALVVASTSFGAANHRTVQILDNCSPSFNDVLGPDACNRKGGIPFGTFVAKFAKGGAQSWRFAPEQVKLASGGSITAVNRGGEFHTFTWVAQFGGGCIDEINHFLGGLTPVAECAAWPGIAFATGVLPGTSLNTGSLPDGTNRFMCLIHPWQRTTVEVG